MTKGKRSHAELEATTLFFFGIFFGVLSVVVLLGTMFADKRPAQITSIAAGLTLVLVAAISLYASRRITRGLRKDEHT